ncbi:MAG: GTP-binding protein [Armatimonadota bacterium]
MAFLTEHIRNLVLTGHRGSGKTSLLEGMLFATGAIERLGRVDAGTSTADFEPEEIARKISIAPALVIASSAGSRST